MTLVSPKYIFVAVAGEFQPGLAIGLRFRLKMKRSFSFVVFIHASPMTFLGDHVFEELSRVGQLSLMGPRKPLSGFIGKIEAEALTEAEIHKAISDYHCHFGVWNFPPDYLNDLEKALEINPKSNCIVGIECVNQI